MEKMTDNQTLNQTLGDALPAEMARVRDEVMPAYAEIGAAGRVALMMMRAELDAAAKAMAEGDVVAMLAAYKSLKEFNT
jgi:molybdopterin converting factor small subunit